SLSAPCADRSDHVGPAAALFLSAESVATSGAGGAARAHRVAAGAYPPAFPVQQPEQHRQPGGERPFTGRTGGTGPVRPVPRQPGAPRQPGDLGRGTGTVPTLPVHRAIPVG